MAELFLNANEFTLDDKQSTQIRKIQKNIYKYKKKTICDYHHMMSRVVCVGEGLADVILSCV